VTQPPKALTESLEDYLEAILALEIAHKVARVKDIADKLGVLRGSVSSALKGLAEKGLIHYRKYSYITLTPEGLAIAREVARRHRVLKDFFLRVLQIDPEKAEANACRMEHALDKTSFDKLVKFVEFIDSCPRTGPDWIEGFMAFCASKDHDAHACRNCLETCLEKQIEADVQ
jgi:DtxR family Mn-dependent transcriptional regulator